MELPTLDKFPRSVLAKIDIQRAFAVSRLIIAAERLQVFRVLHGKRLVSAAIARKLRIHETYAQPFLNALVSLGLLRKRGECYWNSAFAGKYFVGERPVEWTRRYSAECVEDYAALAALEDTLQAGKPRPWRQAPDKVNYLVGMRRNRQQAEDFTQMLFHLHRGEAAALAEAVDFADYAKALDVGGGSGVMSIAIARKNPHLTLCILDIEPVCEIARRNIRRAGLARQVQTLAGDFNATLPSGFDVIMFCDVGAVSAATLNRAFVALPPGGLLVLADAYLNDAGTDPLGRLLSCFGDSPFGVATRRDMVNAVKKAGFASVKARNVYRDVWFITGKKPYH